MNSHKKINVREMFILLPHYSSCLWGLFANLSEDFAAWHELICIMLHEGKWMEQEIMLLES